MATRTLRATDGVTELTWKVTDTGPLVLLGFNTSDGVSGSKLLKNAQKATAWADEFVATKLRLGYRMDRTGRLDAEGALASPCVELSADRTRATLTMSPSFYEPVHELEALTALCSACPLADLTIDDPMYGEQHFDRHVAIVAAHGPALTRLALRHDSFVEPGDHMSSGYTRLENLEALLAGLPTLRELVLEVATIRNVSALRHAALTSLRVKTGQSASGLAPALRTAELPALTSLHVDLLDDRGFSTGTWSGWNHIFKGALTGLTDLAIVNSIDGDAVAADLTMGTVPPALRSLDLSRSGLSARGAARLVEHARRFDRVERLILDGNPLDEAAIAALRGAFGERLVAAKPRYAAEMTVAELIARIQEAGGVARGNGCEPYAAPRPLDPAALGALLAPDDEPLPSSLARWLAFDTSWLPLFEDDGPPRWRVTTVSDFVDGDEARDAILAGLDELPGGADLAEAPAILLPPSASQAHLLVFLRNDDLDDEPPVLGYEKETFWVKYPSFEAFLAHYFAGQ